MNYLLRSLVNYKLRNWNMKLLSNLLPSNDKPGHYQPQVSFKASSITLFAKLWKWNNFSKGNWLRGKSNKFSFWKVQGTVLFFFLKKGRGINKVQTFSQAI